MSKQIYTVDVCRHGLSRWAVGWIDPTGGGWSDLRRIGHTVTVAGTPVLQGGDAFGVVAVVLFDDACDAALRTGSLDLRAPRLPDLVEER